MPQLNPAPWFTTLITTWLIITLILTPLLMHLTYMAGPSDPAHKQTPTDHWYWTWH